MIVCYTYLNDQVSCNSVYSQICGQFSDYFAMAGYLQPLGGAVDSGKDQLVSGPSDSNSCNTVSQINVR